MKKFLPSNIALPIILLKEAMPFLGMVLVGVVAAFAISTSFYPLLGLIIGLLLLFSPLMVVDFRSNRFEKGMFLLLCLILFFDVLWPRYAFIRLGSGPGLNPQRLGLLAIFLATYIVLIKDNVVRDRVSSLVGCHKLFFTAFIVFWVSRLLSCFKADFVLPSLFAFFGDLVNNGAFFVFSIVFISYSRANLIIKLLLFASLLAACIGLVEWRLQRNIFMGIFSIDDAYMAQAVGGIVRDGSYRVQSTFEHPLLFAEYLVMIFPLAITYLYQGKDRLIKLASLLFIVISPLAIYLTGSRSGLISLAIVSILIFVVFLYRKVFAEQKYFYLTIFSILFAVVALFAISYSDNISVLLAGRSSSEASSSHARLIMLSRGLNLWTAQPLLGYGFSSAAEKVGYIGSKGILTIDSYLISVFVESGLLGFAGFMGMFIYPILIIVFRPSKNIERRTWQLALVSSLIGCFSFKLILSLPHNFFLFYVLVAVLMHFSLKDGLDGGVKSEK